MDKTFFDNNMKNLDCDCCVDWQACTRSSTPLCRNGLEIATNGTIEKLYIENCELRENLVEIYRILNVGFGSNAQKEAVRKLEMFSKKFKK